VVFVVGDMNVAVVGEEVVVYAGDDVGDVEGDVGL
jgi:hypothetical protein